MYSFSEEEVKNHLLGLADAEPRADFVRVLEEKLVQETRQLKRSRQLSRWAKWGGAVAACLVLVGAVASPVGQQLWKRGILQEKRLPAAVPNDSGTRATEVMYGAYIGQKYYLCFADAKTMVIKKKVLLSDCGSGFALYRDPQGRIWCPVDRYYVNDIRHEIAVYNPANDQVTHIPFFETVQDVEFIGQDAYVSSSENGMVKLFHLDASLQKKDAVVLGGAAADEKPVFDGTKFTYYDLHMPIEADGTYSGLVRWKPGEKEGEDDVLTADKLPANVELFGTEGQIFMNIKDNPGEFIEYDDKLRQKEILTWEAVIRECQQLFMGAHLQVQIGNHPYTLLSGWSLLTNGKGPTYFALVDSETGKVAVTFHTDMIVNDSVNYINGKFYIVGTNGQVEVYDRNGQQEETFPPVPITTAHFLTK